MVSTSTTHDPKLAQQLVLDELFDLSLYKALRSVTQPDVHHTLDELIKVETSHLAFWQKFFNLNLDELNLGRRIKLSFMMLVCRIFGSTAVHLVLEAIEVHGVRKYLALWREYQSKPLGEALRGILMDEFKHEDVLVTELTKRKINPERIRNIFLGLNDGLVEILGAVSGFFGAFGSARLVLIAALTTAVAGALSMAAGSFLALNSEKEVKMTEIARKVFLGEESDFIPMGRIAAGIGRGGGDSLYYRRTGAGVARLGRCEGCALLGLHRRPHGHSRLDNSVISIRHGHQTTDRPESGHYHGGCQRELCDRIGGKELLGN
jgi:VIT1/CCC1 family predicted Fe2+/Mn2+ transporter